MINKINNTKTFSDYRIVTNGTQFKVQQKETSGFWYWYKVTWRDCSKFYSTKEDAQKTIIDLLPVTWTVVK